ncbi:hypothetical protein Tco_1562836 [Tanacetum coccineum]
MWGKGILRLLQGDYVHVMGMVMRVFLLWLLKEGVIRAGVKVLGVKWHNWKLGIPHLSQLTTFETIPAEKKRKRKEEVIQELFVKENIMVNGMQRNLSLPEGVVGKAGLVIKEPEAGIFLYNGNFDLVFQRRREYQLASTTQLIRIQNLINVDSEYAQQVRDNSIKQNGRTKGVIRIKVYLVRVGERYAMHLYSASDEDLDMVPCFVLAVVKRYSSDVVVAASIVAADFVRLFESGKAAVEDDIRETVKIHLDAHGIDMENSVTGSNVKNHPPTLMKHLEMNKNNNDATRESADYINYLVKSGNSQSCAPTLGRGQGKGYMRRGGLEVNAPKKKKVEVPRRPRTITIADNLLEDPGQAVDLAIHAALVLDKEVNKKVDEAYNAQLKFKLRANEQVSPEAQLLLNLKKGAKESKKERILEEIKKGSGEGSSAMLDSLDHIDSSDNSIWESSDDDMTVSDNDSDKGDNDDDSDKILMLEKIGQKVLGFLYMTRSRSNHKQSLNLIVPVSLLPLKKMSADT